MKARKFLFGLVLALCAAGIDGQAVAGAEAERAPFPRLLGMNNGAKNYDDPEYQKQLARLDIVILGFYKDWKPSYGIERVVRNLKELSGGKILVGQYSNLNELTDNPKNASIRDMQNKVNEMDWWARKADGSRVQWTTQYRNWDINITTASKADAEGKRYPQWFAERNERVMFSQAPFDIWFCDNVFGKPRVTADWDGDGKDDSPKDPAFAAASRAGHRAEWDHIRKIHPGIMLMGNADNDLDQPEYAGQLEGAFLEGQMGSSYSLEKRGWDVAMRRYRAALANTRAPHMVAFNVHGKPGDWQFFRYAYASCLMDDGYFSYSGAKGYSGVDWFDEYDFELGAATSKPPVAAWRDGVWRRDFERGIALVNPTAQPVTITLEAGFKRLAGNQDAKVNNGEIAASVTLKAKDGIILRRE